VRTTRGWLQGDRPGAHRQDRLARGALLARGDQDLAQAEDRLLCEHGPQKVTAVVIIEDLAVARALGTDQQLRPVGGLGLCGEYLVEIGLAIGHHHERGLPAAFRDRRDGLVTLHPFEALLVLDGPLVPRMPVAYPLARPALEIQEPEWRPVRGKGQRIVHHQPPHRFAVGTDRTQTSGARRRPRRAPPAHAAYRGRMVAKS